MYQFTVVPPSLFRPDDSFYEEQEKSVIVEALRKPQNEQEETHWGINGMTFVNKVDIKAYQVHTCLGFVECFINIINNETKKYHEVRIIFDRYNPKLLKSNTRASRSLGLWAVHSKIADNTKTDHLETKEFISSVETKTT